MHYRSINLFTLLVALLIQSTAFAQSGCAKDELGRIVCAPPSGSVVKSLGGLVCAPGRCVSDNLGYLKCSKELGGGAIVDDLGRVSCVGGCVNPSKSFCVVPQKEQK